MIDTDNIRVHVEKRSVLGDDLYLYFYIKDRDRTLSAEITFDEISESTSTPESITIPPEAAQELVDKLWQCGVRPTEGTGSAGALLATQNHVKSLQNIVDITLKQVDVLITR